MSVQLPTVTFNNGVEMPILGFGVYQIPAEETEQAVARPSPPATATSIPPPPTGTRKPSAGPSPPAGSPRGTVRHHQAVDPRRPARSNTKKAFDASLQRLGLGYLDLYLIHQPYGDYYGSWRAMRAFTEKGRGQGDRSVQLLPGPAGGPHRPHRVHSGGQPDRDPPVLPAAERPDLMIERGVQIESWGAFAEGRNTCSPTPP